jgi:hypothetical protein
VYHETVANLFTLTFWGAIQTITNKNAHSDFLGAVQIVVNLVNLSFRVLGAVQTVILLVHSDFLGVVQTVATLFTLTFWKAIQTISN